MKKLLLSTALVVGVLMAPSMALAAQVTMWSNSEVPGYLFEKDRNMWYKSVEIDDKLADNMGKWTMRIERRSGDAPGLFNANYLKR